MPSLSRFRGKPGDDRPPAPFIVGVPRSGTTLLRLMLDAHSELAIPPETHFLPKLFRAADGAPDARERVLELIVGHRRWPDFELGAEEFEVRLPEGEALDPAGAARAFYEAYAAHHGKPRWGEKTPQYVKTMGKIAANLPEARFIHLIRDGRAVALSLLSVSWGPASLEDAARLWVDLIKGARRKAPRLRHYVELRYEDLVADAEPVVREACKHAELPFEPQMLDYHSGAAARMDATARDFQIGGGPQVSADERARQHELVSAPPQPGRVDRWRETMSEADVARFEAVAGPMLDELGYERAAPGS